MGTLIGVLIRTVATAMAVSTLVSGCAVGGRMLATSHPPATDASAPYRLVQEPDDGYQPIIDLIHSANHSVRMAMYQLTDPEAIAALIQAHQRSVDIKIILDLAFHGRTTNTHAYDTLARDRRSREMGAK